MNVSSIGGINRLPLPDQRALYSRLVPETIIKRFSLNPYFTDRDGRDLFLINYSDGSPSVEISLFHKFGFIDPVLYGHLTDTINGKIHILLYVINNPESPRFSVDKMPDGSATKFGTFQRNLPAEEAAMEAGLAPGQIRFGLRALAEAISAFEQFAKDLGHDLYYIEPLYYHNAILFERYGFNYQLGRKKMTQINEGFRPGGEYRLKLDGSSPFRSPGMESTIRSRSWAIHDGILGEPFTDVTMYKVIGHNAGLSTSPNIPY